MATYYPIEFLPENPTLGEPTNRNYLRNNLPYQISSNNQNPNTENDEDVVAQLGKKDTFLESSITNKTIENTYATTVSKELEKERLNPSNKTNTNNYVDS